MRLGRGGRRTSGPVRRGLSGERRKGAQEGKNLSEREERDPHREDGVENAHFRNTDYQVESERIPHLAGAAFVDRHCWTGAASERGRGQHSALECSTFSYLAVLPRMLPLPLGIVPVPSRAPSSKLIRALPSNAYPPSSSSPLLKAPRPRV